MVQFPHLRLERVIRTCWYKQVSTLTLLKTWSNRPLNEMKEKKAARGKIIITAREKPGIDKLDPRKKD